ncbi:MAG: tetratricopeptide repeat protein [Gemmatimonadales bacterium]
MTTATRLSPERIVARMRPQERKRHLKATNAFQRGDLITAARHWERLVSHPTAGLLARYGLAMVAHHARQHRWAIATLEQVVTDEPGFDLAWYNLGTIRQHVADYAGAEVALRETARLNPDFAAARTNLGNALLGQGRHAEALAVFDEALRHPTPDIEARWNRSHALIATGRWLEGWAEYEARWGLPGFVVQNRYHHPSEVYTGQDLHGKRVIVLEEQGYGDLIMTLRFDRDLRAMGAAEVTWAVRPELVRLVRSAGLRAVDINQHGNEAPADYNMSCMSLMRWTRVTPARMPRASGYLHATARRPPGTGLRVGICWEGSPIHRDNGNRSLPKSALGTLQKFDLGGVSWISLCRDGWRPELADAGLVDGLTGVTDWQDTAHRIAGLDLVITVDTAIAHLAGACNVPVWILLAAVPDMRWGLQSSTTPWYRSARLFRQTIGGDWTPVIEQVGAQLGALLTQHTHERIAA